MTEIAELHRKAMELTDEATLRKLRGQSAEGLLRSAFEAERSAALGVDRNLEPTRSVLLRSAASLALECGEPREAERLISIALSGEPPPSIANELRDLLEQVYFERHLDLRGIELSADEVQMSMTGEAIGFGIAKSTQVLDRVNRFESLVYRTAERLLGKQYREAGRRQGGLKQQVELYVSSPRAASFAVTFKIGAESQLSLPGVALPERVVDELLDLLELFGAAEISALKSKIKDEAYLRNFVSLAKSLAPDGRQVRMVGLTSVRQGGQRRVFLSRNRSNIPEHELLPAAAAHQREWIKVQGTLSFADEIKSHHEIRIVDDRERPHRVVVPEGMMNDIVRPMWGREVIIQGWLEGKLIHLEEIEPASE
jgi:hypothetical protein